MARAPMGWGVVGTGDVSRYVLADLALVPGARRRAVCSRESGRAFEFAREMGFERSCGRYDEFLADPQLDVVYVATPHATHRDFAIAALEAGKHVLIEKPMAVDALEAREIAAVARRHGRFAMEAMWMKFTPGYSSLMAALDGGIIGEIQSLRASFGMAFPTDQGSRWLPDMKGSTLLEQGIYGVALADAVLGTPERVTAVGEVRAGGIDVRAHVTFDYASGQYAHISASMIDYIDPSASIGGTGGWIDVPWPFWAVERYEIHDGNDPGTLFSPRVSTAAKSGNGFAPMLKSVTEAIASGLREHPAHPLGTTIRTLNLMDRIRASL